MADDNKIIAELEVRGKEAFIQSLQQGKAASDTLTTSVKEAGVVGSQSLEKLGNEAKTTATEFQKAEKSTASYKTQLKQMQAEIIGLTMDLGKMRTAGKEGTDEFNKLQQKIKQLTDDAGELKDVIGDVSDTVKNAGSDTRGIDNALRGINAMASGFQVVEGATALFGVENEKLQQTLVRLNAVMAITNGLQQIQDELLKNDSVFTQAAAKAKQLYAAAMNGATAATRAFYVLATGGLLLVLGLVVQNWEKISKWLGIARDSTEELAKATERLQKAEQDRKALQDAELRYLKAKGVAQDEILKKEIAIAEAELSKLETQMKIASFRFVNPNDPNAFEAQKRATQEAAEVEKQYQAQLLSAKANVLELKKALTDYRVEQAKEITEKVKGGKDKNKVDIEALQLLDITDKTSRAALQAQLDFYQQLRDRIDPTLPAYRELIELIDVLQRKLEGKQTVEIDTSNVLSSLNKFIPKGKPLTLFERIFGTEDENRTKQERMTEGARKITQQLVAFGEELADVSSKAMSVRTQREIQELQNKRDKGLITQKEYDKKEAQIKNEAARKQRIVDIAMATAKIPLLVLNALVSAPFPANVILASLAGALGLAQVAILAATPLPKFKTGGSVAKKLGLIRGRSHEHGGVPIEVEGNEFVMNKRAVAKYGVGFMEKINDMKFNPIVNADKKLKSKSDSEYKLNESLATISTYLKQGYKVDAYGNKILEQIRDNLNTRNQYV